MRIGDTGNVRHPGSRRTTPFVLRELWPDDLERLPELVRRCSARTLRDRFFGCVNDPVTWLACTVREAVWEGCAVGCIVEGSVAAVATGTPQSVRTWEMAVLVRDDLQGRGLGTQTAMCVLDAARQEGVALYAAIEGRNGAAVGLGRRLTVAAGAHPLRVEVW